MAQWGGRVVALTAALVAGLLVEAGPAGAVVSPVAAGPPPAVLAAPPVGAPLPRLLTAGPAPVGTPTPAQAAQAAFGPVGSLVVLVAAHAAEDGSVAGDADRPVPTASRVKLYLAEGVLAAARATGTPLAGVDRLRIEAALTSSDDLATSQLWVDHDGPAVLADVAARYGLRGTTPPVPDPGAWGSTATTAADLARFLVDLPHRAHPDDAALLLGLLARVTPVGADGFDQSFGLLGPARVPGAAVKQGWMCCTSGVRHLHSVGVVDGRVVVMLAEFPVEVGWPTARAALDAAAVAAVSR